MKKTLRFTFTLLFSLALFSCNESVNVSPEMQGFIDNLDGSHKDLQNALHEFGAENLIEEERITELDLSDPKIISCTGDKSHSCYEFEAKAGKTKKLYEVCWEGKKIASMHASDIARQ